nr:hypothetical protein [Tanacetum cinerariifolium]
MDLFSFIQVADPTKVKVGKKERAEREIKLLESIVGCVVLLLPVASARAKNEMDTSVEKLFDESGGTNQGDSIVGGDDAEIELVTAMNDVVAGNVTAERPKGHRRKGPVVTDASGFPILLTIKRDHETPGVSSIQSVRVVILRIQLLGRSLHHWSAALSSVITEALITSTTTGIVRLDVMGSSRIPRKELSMGSREEFIDHLAPLVLLSQISSMDYHYLFMEFIVGTAHQACLNAKVRMRTEYYLSVRRRLELEGVNQANLLKVRDDEVEKLKAQLLLKETKATKAARSLDRKVMELDSLVSAKDLELEDLNIIMSPLKSQNDSLVDQVSGNKHLKEQTEEFQNVQMKIVDDKVAKLDADLLEMACHLEDKFYLYLLTTISGQRWLLSYDPKLILVKCLNSSKCLTALGAAISRAIKHGMHIGLATRIDHDKEGPLVDAPGMSDLHPEVEFLWLPIHRSNDQVVLGKTSLSFAVIVSHSHAKQIRADIAAKRSALMASIEATTALPTTFASASFIPPIIIEDYEIAGADGWEDPQENVQGNVASFPIINFEKEWLDTTLEHDLSG